MTEHFKRRTVLKGTGAMLALTAAPFGPALAQEERLRLTWWGSTERHERTQQAADVFTGRTGIAVDGEGYGWGDYWPRLATQAAGGNAPDLVQMHTNYIHEYIRRGALMPLDDLLPGNLDLDDFDQDQLDIVTVDGQLYGVCLGAAVPAMMINVDAFEEAGIELPERGLDWLALGRLGAELAEASGRPNFYGLSDGSGQETPFEVFLRQRGRTLWSAEGGLGYAPEDAAAWFELWAEIRGMGGCVPPDMQALDQLSIDTAMVTLGHAAISFAWSNESVGFQAVNQERIAVAPLPVAEDAANGGHQVLPTQFLSISADSDMAEAGAAFIGFFVKDPEAIAILGAERGVPTSASAREVLAPLLDETGRLAFEYVSGIGDLGVAPAPPPPANAGEMTFVLKRISEEVGFGQRTPADAGAAIVEEGEAILART